VIVGHLVYTTMPPPPNPLATTQTPQASPSRTPPPQTKNTPPGTTPVRPTHKKNGARANSLITNTPADAQTPNGRITSQKPPPPTTPKPTVDPTIPTVEHIGCQKSAVAIKRRDTTRTHPFHNRAGHHPASKHPDSTPPIDTPERAKQSPPFSTARIRRCRATPAPRSLLEPCAFIKISLVPVITHKRSGLNSYGGRIYGARSRGVKQGVTGQDILFRPGEVSPG